jgi:hypothetical protein
MSTTRDMLDAAIRGGKATIPTQAVQEQEMVSTEPVQVTNGQAKAPGTVAVQTANDSSTETPVVTTITPTPTPVKTATPVANITTDTDGEGGTPGATKTIPVTPTPTPAPTETKTETKVPTWEEIVNELSKADEESEETKAKMKKKQRIATAIAALGDLATHAINVWGATNGYNAPIKGAPLTEGVTAKHKLDLAEHDARLERLKRLKLDAAEARRKDLYDRIKLGEFQRKERESAEKAEYNKLKEELTKANIEYKKEMIAYRNAKTEQDKEKHRKELELLDVKKANLEDQMAKRGISSSKRTYTVDGVTYDNLAEAYVALPEEYQIKITTDLNGRPNNPTTFDREEAIAKYNRDKKTSSAEQPAQQGKKEEKPKATSLKVNTDGTKEVIFS